MERQPFRQAQGPEPVERRLRCRILAGEVARAPSGVVIQSGSFLLVKSVEISGSLFRKASDSSEFRAFSLQRDAR
jgi:hypothetical protein